MTQKIITKKNQFLLKNCCWNFTIFLYFYWLLQQRSWVLHLWCITLLVLHGRIRGFIKKFEISVILKWCQNTLELLRNLNLSMSTSSKIWYSVCVIIRSLKLCNNTWILINQNAYKLIRILQFWKNCCLDCQNWSPDFTPYPTRSLRSPGDQL